MAWTRCYGLLGLCGKKLKTPIFTFDLTLNLSTSSENCFKAFIGASLQELSIAASPISLRPLVREFSAVDSWRPSQQVAGSQIPQQIPG